MGVFKLDQVKWENRPTGRVQNLSLVHRQTLIGLRKVGQSMLMIIESSPELAPAISALTSVRYLADKIPAWHRKTTGVIDYVLIEFLSKVIPAGLIGNDFGGMDLRQVFAKRDKLERFSNNPIVAMTGAEQEFSKEMDK